MRFTRILIIMVVAIALAACSTSTSNNNNNNANDAEKSEEMVVQNLEQFLKQAEQQERMLRDMREGNFERLMPFNPQEGFVFIPKEAAYTVPVDYKEKIIEMSKKRGRSTAEKEEF